MYNITLCYCALLCQDKSLSSGVSREVFVAAKNSIITIISVRIYLATHYSDAAESDGATHSDGYATETVSKCFDRIAKGTPLV